MFESEECLGGCGLLSHFFGCAPTRSERFAIDADDRAKERLLRRTTAFFMVGRRRVELFLSEQLETALCIEQSTRIVIELRKVLAFDEFPRDFNAVFEIERRDECLECVRENRGILRAIRITHPGSQEEQIRKLDPPGGLRKLHIVDDPRASERQCPFAFVRELFVEPTRDEVPENGIAEKFHPLVRGYLLLARIRLMHEGRVDATQLSRAFACAREQRAKSASSCLSAHRRDGALSRLAEDEHAVMPTEAERIRKRDIDRSFARDVRNVIEGTLRVGKFVVRRRRHDVVIRR